MTALLRSALKDWRFASMVILTLTVCISANTALFTIVNSVLLEPLPVPEANRILVMANAYPKAGLGKAQFSGVADYYDRLRDVKVFEEQALFNLGAQTIDDNGSPERIPGMAATPSLFRLLRVPPELGRTFIDDEGELGANQKVILSHGLWQRLFAGDRAALGRELRLNGRPFTIVGVMPQNFLFVDPTVRFWVPLAFPPQQKQARHSNNWYNIGRLKPGATVAQAQAQVDAINAANMQRFPQWKEALTNAGFHTEVQPLQNLLVKDVQGTLYLLWGGAAFVLLIGAVNIANLALARATQRMKEFATRLALGASHSRIAGQLIAENVLIALTGGIAGLALGANILKALGKIGLDRFPRADEVHVGVTVILFSLSVAIVAGIAIAVVPLARIFRADLTTALRENSRTGTSGRQSRFARQALVVGQIAFAFVLLAGAGLLLASFRWLMNVDPGFRTEGVLTASTAAPPARYAGAAELRTLVDRSLDAIRLLPGVIAAGATTSIPFSGNQSDSVIIAETYVMKPGESMISPLQLIATPGYMEAMGMALVRGRYFDQHDTESSPRVVMVDERLARKFWSGRDPIGQRMFLPAGPDETRPNEHTQWLKVVGVVRSARLSDITGGGNSAGAYYFPFAQTPQRGYTFAVRTASDASAAAVAVRGAIAGVDPTLALFDVKTMDERKQLSLASERTSMSLALAFAALALFLSAVGIYSVLSYLLGQRRREIGIRLAVGASPAGIFKLFIREGAILIAIGLALGFAGSIALRRTIENQIYGVQPLDPRVIGLVTIVLGAIALAACLRPAREAMRVDPVVVLNEQ
ncbi:MAG TPA: ABC transporter permease [Bryobacteraceae bacterium]|nr:ABC transporter permease [Bryobacteraceae bacterium]